MGWKQRLKEPYYDRDGLIEWLQSLFYNPRGVVKIQIGDKIVPIKTCTHSADGIILKG